MDVPQEATPVQTTAPARRLSTSSQWTPTAPKERSVETPEHLLKAALAAAAAEEAAEAGSDDLVDMEDEEGEEELQTPSSAKPVPASACSSSCAAGGAQDLLETEMPSAQPQHGKAEEVLLKEPDSDTHAVLLQRLRAEEALRQLQGLCCTEDAADASLQVGPKTEEARP